MQYITTFGLEIKIKNQNLKFDQRFRITTQYQNIDRKR